MKNSTLNKKNIIKHYDLKQMRSCFTGELYETWFRNDMMFFIESPIWKQGEMIEKYRILPNTNDVDKIGHIDFTKLEFKSFEEAAKKMVSLKTT